MASRGALSVEGPQGQRAAVGGSVALCADGGRSNSMGVLDYVQ